MIPHEKTVILTLRERLLVWCALTRFLFKGMIRKEDNLCLIKLGSEYSLSIEFKAIREFI